LDRDRIEQAFGNYQPPLRRDLLELSAMIMPGMSCFMVGAPADRLIVTIELLAPTDRGLDLDQILAAAGGVACHA
jgi:hypothetical protein